VERHAPGQVPEDMEEDRDGTDRAVTGGER
jgi:hypothetical protein